VRAPTDKPRSDVYTTVTSKSKRASYCLIEIRYNVDFLWTEGTAVCDGSVVDPDTDPVRSGTFWTIQKNNFSGFS
jgi:hypothetical protein